MDFLQIFKYQVKNPILKPWINYFWIMNSSKEICINHKLLPVGNIDFILNFSSPIKYTLQNKNEQITRGFHINGIRNQYCRVHQKDKLNIYGISFFPAGVYPFLGIPLSEFTNNTFELDILLNNFSLKIEEKLTKMHSITNKINVLENELIKLIKIDIVQMREVYKIFDCFKKELRMTNVSCFCEKYGISQRRLERIFNKYIGITPKFFQKLHRFKMIVSRIERCDYQDLTSLAYEYEYYDQNHFVKDFKYFTGCSPSRFLNEQMFVKQMII